MIIKYVNQLEQVDKDRIGLIGHSGGSSTANLVIWLTDEIKAEVRDHESEYRNLFLRYSLFNPFIRIHCETIPALYPYYLAIKDTTNLDISVLSVSYGFRDIKERKKILNFFKENI